MNLRLCLGLLVVSVSGAFSAATAQVQPWPGEPWTQATTLTHLDPAFAGNLSGAHWNSVTRTLWVVCNGPERFWALVEDGAGGWKVAEKGGARAEYSVFGDTEGITQADLSEDVVYVIDEDAKAIQAFDVSIGGAPVHVNSWKIQWYMPLLSLFGGGNGPEGIAFVPDNWLTAQGFVDPNGNPRVSRHGMGGLMFVGHQEGGNLYVFDLNRVTGAFDFVGSYATGYGETSGLEFDRSTGELSMWHNTGNNVIEITDLTSFAAGSGPRRMTPTALIEGPKTGNLEGIAHTPDASGEGWWWFTDDSNQHGAALMWFQNYPTGGGSAGGQSSLTAALGSASPGDGAVGPAAAEVAMIQLRLTAGSQDVTLQRVTVHAQGTGDDATEVRSVSLWRDADSDGVLSAPDTRLGLTTVFPSDDGAAEFGWLSERIAAGAAQDYLVTETFAARAGVTFQVAFGPMADLLAVDATGATLLPTGTTLIGGAQRTAAGAGGGSVAPGVTAGSGGGGSGGGCSLRPADSGEDGAAVLLVLLGLFGLRRRGRG